jgi:hypothetical protein
MSRRITDTNGPNHDIWVNTLRIGETVINEDDLALLAQTNNATLIGAAPATSGLACSILRNGRDFQLTFTLTALSVAITDGGVSGSHGATKLFDFVESSIAFMGSRANYTAFAEGAALTTAAGDANFVIGLGTTAISAAADKSLGSTTQVNVGASLELTNSGGTTTGSRHTGPLDIGVVDGTSTAADLYLNVSGSAATIDATSTLAVTGTITVNGTLLGDD